MSEYKNNEKKKNYFNFHRDKRRLLVNSKFNDY